MESFGKATAVVLLTVILALAVGKQEKDIGVVLTMAACCLIGLAAVSYLAPVLDLLWELGDLGKIQSDTIGILMKAVGIALISELVGTLCADAGNASLGKMLQMLGSAVILYLSIPVFKAFLTMLRDILGEL